MAKQVRMEDEDRISNLPDSILRNILSFLPFKEAVRTSILSTKWRRYRWPLLSKLSNLDFEFGYDDDEHRLLSDVDHEFIDVDDDDDGGDDDDDEHWVQHRKRESSAFKSFVTFVDKMMFLHNETSIETFRLKCRRLLDLSHVYAWISAALWRGVQYIDLNVSVMPFEFTLPRALFTSRKLVTLKLCTGYNMNIPHDVCFPSLKTLHLQQTRFVEEDSIKRLFSSCISLEDMVIEGCHVCSGVRNFKISHHLLKKLTIINLSGYISMRKYWMVIDAPVLVYFKYNELESALGYSLENLQCLVSADIAFRVQHYTSFPQLADATPFFRGICNIQSLNLSPISVKVLLSCVPVPLFPNLVQLKIWYDCHLPRLLRDYYSHEKGVAGSLLSCFPKLEKLVFCQEVFNYMPEEVPFCLSCKLKAVEISEFEAGKKCIEKAKYFLENAGGLEKLTIRTRNLAENEKSMIAEELMTSPMKSDKCCILIV